MSDVVVGGVVVDDALSLQTGVAHGAHGLHRVVAVGRLSGEHHAVGTVQHLRTQTRRHRD